MGEICITKGGKRSYNRVGICRNRLRIKLGPINVQQVAKICARALCCLAERPRSMWVFCRSSDTNSSSSNNAFEGTSVDRRRGQSSRDEEKKL